MSKVELRDLKNGNEQSIDSSGASLNIVKPLPPFGGAGSQRMRIFRQFLTDDGTSTGSSDMKVNGSSTNVDFWVPASPTNDRYITSLSFVIADAGAVLNEFGNINALSNGCVLEYTDEMGVVTIHGSLTTNFKFVRLCSGNPAFGTGNASFRATNVSGASEAFFPTLDLIRTFGFQWGILLKAGSKQKLTLRVRDNVSGVDQFDCIAYGFERSPD